MALLVAAASAKRQVIVSRIARPHGALEVRSCCRMSPKIVLPVRARPSICRNSGVTSRLSTVRTYASTSLVPQSPGSLQASEGKLAPRARRLTDFAVKFAHLTRTYEVHTWHLVMGLLQVRDGLSAAVLRECGIDNMDEAFLEILYCFKLADALEPKAFHADVSFTNKAVHVLEHACWIARCLGHQQADAEHILASLAFYEVFEELFPDLDLSEDRVWKALHSSWDARDISSDPNLLKKQAKKFEKLFREYPSTKYSYPALEKFERVGPFY